MAAGLTVGDGIQVVLANGAQAGNVFWQVGTSATIGTSAAFNGTIMAYAAVTMGTTSTMTGRALAGTAVTFDGSSLTLPASSAPIGAQGSLQVTLEPFDAVGAGAQWQVDGGPVQNSGAILTNVSAGNYTVSFTPVSGLNTPADQTVTITNGATTAISSVYTLKSTAQSGALTVALLPAKAVSAGAQWQLEGTNQNSETTVTTLPAGNYTVSFTPISGWNTPSNETVTVTAGVTTQASGIYTTTNAPSNRLTLLTNGDGAIQHGAWPSNLVMAKTYRVTGVPAAKNVFYEWMGGTAQPYTVLSLSTGYTFTMKSNLVLEANFVTNVFPTAQGTYRGLFAPTTSARQQTNSGSFLFNVSSTGAVSGRLDLGGRTVPFSGKFDQGGAATNIVSSSEPSLTTTLQLDFADQSVSGTVSNDTFTAELNGDRDVFSGSQKATNFEGQYTLVVPGTTNTNAGPFGVGYGTVKVTALGTITLGGSLADGTAVNQSSVVSKDGLWPLYVSLYGGKGSLWGWIYFTNNTITNAVALSWINETNTSKRAVYRSGFTNQDATLMGELYVSTNTLPGDLTSTLEGGDLPFAIVVTNLSENTNKLTLKTNKTTGVISGSFANPAAPEQKIMVNGVVLQSQTNAQGYFLGTNQSGTFTLGLP